LLPIPYLSLLTLRLPNIVHPDATIVLTLIKFASCDFKKTCMWTGQAQLH